MRLSNLTSVVLSVAIGLGVALPVSAEKVHVAPEVISALVYRDGAEVTREIKLDLAPGEHEVIVPVGNVDFFGLPSISTSDNISILAVSSSEERVFNTGAFYTEEQKQLLQALENAEDILASHRLEMAKVQARIDEGNLRIDLAKSLASKSGDLPSAEDFATLSKAAAQELAAAKVAVVEANEDYRRMKRRLKELETRAMVAARSFSITKPVDENGQFAMAAVNVTGSGPQVIQYKMATRDAGWVPAYNVEFDRDAGRVTIERNLAVFHHLDEVWRDVSIALTTDTVTKSVDPTYVIGDRASIREVIPAETFALSKSDSDLAGAPVMEIQPVMEETHNMTGLGFSQGLSLRYEFDYSVTIYSDEGAILSLGDLVLPASEFISAAPRHDDKAFLMADVTNTSSETLIAGPASVVRDGNIVGQTVIPEIAAGQSREIGFGPYDGILLDVNFDRKDTGDTGIVRSRKTREQVITFSVENLTDERQEIRTLYALPYSEQEDLTVDVETSLTPQELGFEGRRNVARWYIELAPGEKRDVQIDIHMTWPEEYELRWHP